MSRMRPRSSAIANDGSGVLGSFVRVLLAGEAKLRSGPDRNHRDGPTQFPPAKRSRRARSQRATERVVPRAAGRRLRAPTARGAVTTWGQPDGDDAMVMLMSLRASQGHFSLLFWGGNYGGAIITWIEAPLIVVFGMKIWLFKTRRHAAMSLIAALLLRSIGRRFLSPNRSRRCGGNVLVLPRAVVVLELARVHLLVARDRVRARDVPLRAPLVRVRVARRDLLAAGLCAGLAIWSYPLVFPLVGPARRRVSGRCARTGARLAGRRRSRRLSASPRGSRTSRCTGDRRRSCRRSRGTGSPT